MKKWILLLPALLSLASCKTSTEPLPQPQYDAQCIDLPGVTNARQLGGYPVGNKRIRQDVLIRTGALKNASDEAVKALCDKYGLAMVADFRTSMERGKSPDRDVPGARNIWFPILEENTKGEDGAIMASLHLNTYNTSYTLELLRQPKIQESVRKSYETIVFDENHQRSYAAFLDSLVALPDGRAALWHCSHGKDRCGWGTAFVLAALGADRNLIVADFLLSNIPYAEEIDNLTSFANAEWLAEGLDEDIRLLRGVSGLYFEKVLDSIDTRYGSLDNFLEKALSLTPEEKQSLREKFLVE